MEKIKKYLILIAIIIIVIPNVINLGIYFRSQSIEKKNTEKCKSFCYANNFIFLYYEKGQCYHRKFGTFKQENE